MCYTTRCLATIVRAWAAKQAHRLGVTPVTGTRDGTLYASHGRMAHGGRAVEMVPGQAPVWTRPATSCRWLPWQGKARTTHTRLPSLSRLSWGEVHTATPVGLRAAATVCGVHAGGRMARG